MTRAHLFPLALMLLSIGAALVYMAEGDLRRCLYWLAATVITACVTF